MTNSLASVVRFVTIILLLGILTTGAVQGAAVVQINWNGYVSGMFGDQVRGCQIQLFDDQVANTVTNFLNYVNHDDYDGTIIHRSGGGADPKVPDMLQGGGFEQVKSGNIVTALTPIPTHSPIALEAEESNLRGTIAMARTDTPNSATSQWFINTSDNLFLDKYTDPDPTKSRDGYAVFGHVAGEGMKLMDSIFALPVYNLNSQYDPNGSLGNPFKNVPMYNNGSSMIVVKSVDVISTVEWKGGNSADPNNWGVAANWDPNTGVPDGVGVNLSLGNTSNDLDLYDADRTIGNIYYTITANNTKIQSIGGQTLTLDNGGKTSLVNVLGNHSINTKLRLNNNTIFSVTNAGDTLVLNNNISGTGGIGQNGLGTLTIRGTNSFTGDVKLHGGTTVIDHVNNFGNGTNLELNGATIKFDGDADISKNASAAARTVTIMDGGVTLDTQSFDVNITGPIGNNNDDNDYIGSLTKNGTGTLALLGANTFKGAVNINSGTIKANSADSFGVGGDINFNSAGTLLFDGVFDPSSHKMKFTATATLDTQANDITLANAIGNDGAGGMTKKGSGILTLTKSPTYKGTTTISEGTLKLGTGAFLSSTKNVTLLGDTKLDINGNSQTLDSLSDVGSAKIGLGGGTLIVGGTNTTLTIASEIISTTGGNLTKTGTGMLTLSGTNTFKGALNLNAGTILASKKENLGVGAQLIFGGGGLKFGEAFDPSTGRTVTFQSTATFDTNGKDIPVTNSIGNNGLGGLTKIGTGTLALTGANTFKGAVNINQGTIKVNSLAGLGTGSAINFNNNGATLLFDGVFDPSVRAMTFNSTATLDTQAHSITLTKAIGNNQSGGLTKKGTGILTLAVSPTYLGATTVEQGTLKLGSGAVLLSANPVELKGTATLDISGNTQSLNSLKGPTGSTVKLGGGTLILGGTNSSDELGSNIISTTGGTLTKTGTGTLTLSGANDFKNALNFNGGLIKASSLNNLGDVGAQLIFNGGGLKFGGVFDPSSYTMTFQSGAATLDTFGNDIKISEAIGNGGAGGLTKAGLGTLTLQGNNTFSGYVTIKAGTINVFKASNLGTGNPLIFNGGTLQFSDDPLKKYDGFDPSSTRTMTFQDGGAKLDTMSNNVTLAHEIGNYYSGSLTKLGSGTLTLSGLNTFTGKLIINEGAVKAGVLRNLGDGTAIDFNGGTLIFDGVFDPSVRTMSFLPSGATLNTLANNITLSKSIGNGGAGGLIKRGTGMLTLNAVANYFDNVNGTVTEIAEGTIKLGTGGALPASTAVNLTKKKLDNTDSLQAVLDINGNAQTIKSLTGVAGSEVKLGTGSLTTGTVDSTFEGVISSSGATGGLLTKTGSGKFTLTGVNTFTGPVNFNGGWIKAKALNNLGAGTALNFNGGGLQFDGVYDPSLRTMTFQSNVTLDTQAYDITLTNAIGNNGAGGLTKNGTGQLILAGTNTFKGAVNLTAGTIQASALSNLGTGTALNFTGGTLQFGGVFDPSSRTMTFQNTATLDTQANNITLNNPIGNNGSGGLIKDGVGSLMLSAANTYKGTTRVNKGILKTKSAAALPGYTTDAQVVVNTGATLSVRAGAATGEWAETEIETLLTKATFNTGSFFDIDTTGGNFAYTKIIGKPIGISKSGINTLTLSGVNTFTGPVNFNGGLIKVDALNKLGEGTVLNFNGGGLQFNGVFDPSARTMNCLAGGATLDTNGKDITLANAIGNNGDGGLTKKGTGILTLSLSPTYKGTTVVSAGTLKLATGATLLAATSADLNVSGAVLDINGNAQTLKSLIGSAGTQVKLGAGSLTTGTESSSFAGVISGGGSLTKTGAGTLVLTGLNTFTGAVNLNGGLIKATTLNNLGAGTDLNFNGGGLQFGSVALDPSARKMDFLAGGATLDTQSFNISLANAIGNGGAGGLTKQGTGTLTLNKTINYQGATVISGGELKINNNLTSALHAISGAGNLTVAGLTSVLSADSINVQTLTIGAGSKIVINALSGSGGGLTPLSSASTNVQAVPEPNTLVLLIIAATAMLFAAWRRK